MRQNNCQEISCDCYTFLYIMMGARFSDGEEKLRKIEKPLDTMWGLWYNNKDKEAEQCLVLTAASSAYG